MRSSFYYRGAAYRVKGQLDRAIADLSEAIRLAPDVTEFYLGRGTTNFAAGHFEAAVSDIARGVREKPGDGYAVVWVYLARLRANGPDALAELKINAEWVKRDEWPYAVVTLYLGRGSPEAVLAAAGKPDDRCEAHFYIGAWRLARGERAEASEALKAAVDTCPKDFVEYSGAQAELKRMAAAVSSERREVWVRFGCETVRSDTDRSIIKAERREGYFKSIRLVANGPIEFRDLRIHHIDRTFQDVRMPRAEQPAGASTPAIDLTVQNNAIERIDVIYRAKDTTRICVEGLD